MKWASSCQVSFSDLQEAVDDCVKVCKQDMGAGAEVDLALVFISNRFTETRGGATPLQKKELVRAMETIKAELGAKHVLGCLGGGVLGMGEEKAPEEFEDFKAVSIVSASLPGVNISPFRVSAKSVPDTDATQEDWRKLLGNTDPSEEPVIICLAEPQMSASSALDRFLEGMDFAYPGCVKVGGLAAPSLQSASTFPSVFSSDTVHDSNNLNPLVPAVTEFFSMSEGNQKVGPQVV
jgi:small ligand-binding sensory domain FIST